MEENKTLGRIKKSQLSGSWRLNKVIRKGGTRIYEQRYEDEESILRKAFQAKEIANAKALGAGSYLAC